MEAVKFTQGTNIKGQAFWFTNDLSGLFINRKRSVIDGKFYYPVTQYTANGPRIIGDFNSLDEAKAFVARQAGA